MIYENVYERQTTTIRMLVGLLECDTSEFIFEGLEKNTKELESGKPILNPRYEPHIL
jgi:hypothetical protein